MKLEQGSICTLDDVSMLLFPLSSIKVGIMFISQIKMIIKII